MYTVQCTVYTVFDKRIMCIHESSEILENFIEIMKMSLKFKLPECDTFMYQSQMEPDGLAHTIPLI